MIALTKKLLPKIFRSSETIAGAALIIAAFSIASRVLGVLRDRILAGTFGAGQTLDIYYAAFRFPDLIFNLLVLGALSAGFIPIFSSLMSKGEDQKAWRLTNNIFNILSLGLTVLCSFGIIFAPWLTTFIAPGFAPEAQTILIPLSRIMFISPLLLGISSIVGSVLQSKRRFFVYSLSPIFYNLGIITGALFLAPRFGIIGLAWGVVGGSLLHLLIQLPTFFRLGFRYRMIFEWRDRNVLSVFKMMSARTFSLAVTQVNLIVITIIASTLATGSLAIFNLANNLQFFPVSIFGISFALAVFPLMAATEDRVTLRHLFSRTFRQILFFIIPATVIVIALRAQIVRLVLGSGKFDWTATVLTIETLGFFAVSFFAQATLPLLNRAFFAQKDSRTPLYTGLVAEVVNIILSIWLSRKYGPPGLALGFSISTIVNFVLLFVFLHRRLSGLDERRIVISIFKFTIAALLAGCAIQAMKLLVWPYVDMSRFWGVLLQATTAGIFGGIVYLGTCSLLKSEEFLEIWKVAKGRLLKPSKDFKADDQGEARGI
jgi:putative peptidoglycan lipid II flippase